MPGRQGRLSAARSTTIPVGGPATSSSGACGFCIFAGLPAATWRCIMKLSPAQVRRVEENIVGQVVPEGHAAAPELETVFGRHTFFLDEQGLSIVDPSPLDGEMGNLVNVASW